MDRDMFRTIEKETNLVGTDWIDGYKSYFCEPTRDLQRALRAVRGTHYENDSFFKLKAVIIGFDESFNLFVDTWDGGDEANDSAKIVGAPDDYIMFLLSLITEIKEMYNYRKIY